MRSFKPDTSGIKGRISRGRGSKDGLKEYVRKNVEREACVRKVTLCGGPNNNRFTFGGMTSWVE